MPRSDIITGPRLGTGGRRMALDQARRLGIRRVRRPPWPPGAYLEFCDPAEVPGPPPPLAGAHYAAVVKFLGWVPVDRLYWRLPWEDYEALDLHGED
jgi:hypothetical protein